MANVKLIEVILFFSCYLVLAYMKLYVLSDHWTRIALGFILAIMLTVFIEHRSRGKWRITWNGVILLIVWGAFLNMTDIRHLYGVKANLLLDPIFCLFCLWAIIEIVIWIRRSNNAVPR